MTADGSPHPTEDDMRYGDAPHPSAADGSPAVDSAAILAACDAGHGEGWYPGIEPRHDDMPLVDPDLVRALVAELDAQRGEVVNLRDRAVCSGCGQDVDEGGYCSTPECDDGEMIPASELPGALLHASEQRTAERDEWRADWEQLRAEAKQMEAERDSARRERSEAIATAARAMERKGQAVDALREAIEGFKDLAARTAAIYTTATSVASEVSAERAQAALNEAHKGRRKIEAALGELGESKP